MFGVRIYKIILLSALLLLSKSFYSYGSLDTLRYLYSAPKIGQDEAMLYSRYILSHVRPIPGYREAEKDSMTHIWKRVWSEYIDKTIRDNSFSERENNFIYTSAYYFAMTNEKFYIGENYFRRSLEKNKLSIRNEDKYELLLRLSIFYNKIGEFTKSRRILLENIDDVLQLDDDQLKANYYHHLCEEYSYLYHTHKKFEPEYKRINEECLKLSLKAGDSVVSAFHTMIMANLDSPDKIDYYYQKALRFIIPSDKLYKLHITGIQNEYLGVLYTKNQYKKFLDYAFLYLEDSEKNELLWSARISRSYKEIGMPEKGLPYLDNALALYDKEKDLSIRRQVLKDLSYICMSYGKYEYAYLFEKEKNDLNIHHLVSETFGENEVERFNAELMYEKKNMEKQKSIALFISILFIISVIASLIIYWLYLRLNQNTHYLNQTLDQLKIVNNNLEVANKDIEAFAYTAAHDIQNPLHSIMGFLQLVKEQEAEKISSSSKEYIGFMEKSLVNLRRILRNIINYAQISHTPLEPEVLAIDQIIAECIMMLHSDIKESNADIKVDENLPHIYGYPELIQQLFLNLISNSLKYSREKVDPVVEISSQKMGDETHIHLRDNGIGIPEKSMEQIFELFSRGSNSQSYEGAGVGLSIVKKITTVHKAEIIVKNNYDHGVTFTLIFPGTQVPA